MNEIPIIPGRGLVTPMSTRLRIEYLESIDIKVDNLGQSQLILKDLQHNIESFIGTTEIPLGLVGPLLFKEAGQEELVYCAAGTLEGALIASMNRGAKALSKSGGFTANIAWQKMCRAPLFLFENETEATVFKQFIKDNFSAIKQEAEKYSNHAKLMTIDIVQIQSNVHLKFFFTTGDASGQNMTTTCTWHAMLFIADKFKLDKGIIPLDFVIEGNGAADKKVSANNIKEGRGINVTATCFLTEKVINEVLRTSSEKLLRCFDPSKQLAIQDGMVGYNINVANAIASIFVATGQDLASIHESGIGLLHLEAKDTGLLLQLNLPNLVIGTIGGGTHLPKQSQALEMMHCLGSGKVERFAKLIAGFALGLEISTYAAIVSGEFAKAHEKLGRNKPVKWLLRSDLTQSFLKASLNGFFHDKEVQDISVVDNEIMENGILTNVTARISKKLIGFVPIIVGYKNENNASHFLNLLIKSKALDEEVIKGLHLIAASIDPELSDLLKTHKAYLEYKNCHLKELKIYQFLNSVGFKNIPNFYGSHEDSEREIYFFIQEMLNEAEIKIMNSSNHPEHWNSDDIIRTIEVITEFHQLNKSTELNVIEEFKPWQSAPLYKKLLDILIKENPESKQLLTFLNLYLEIDALEAESNAIEISKTLVHNDFNSRNIAVNKDGKIIIYDWELAVVDYPHRDIVEFLSFVLPENFEKDTLYFYLQTHFNLYQNVAWEEWLKASRYSLKNYIVSRVLFYEVSGILIKYDFSKRILKTALRMLNFLNENE